MRNQSSQPAMAYSTPELLSDDAAGRHTEAASFGGGGAGCAFLCSACSPAPAVQPNSTSADTFLFSLAREPRRRKGGSSQLGICGHAHDITVQDGGQTGLWAPPSLPPSPSLPVMSCHFTTGTRIRADGRGVLSDWWLVGRLGWLVGVGEGQVQTGTVDRQQTRLASSALQVGWGYTFRQPDN